MLSIIICSLSKITHDSLFNNIKKTVGCDYEIIVIDNSENKFSIFEAYNQGIERAKSSYLIFIHEDIIFHTLNWGNLIQTYFNERSKAGLIGIAGSKIKTKTPSAWWENDPEYLCLNVLQHSKEQKVKKEFLGFKDSDIKEVVTIDGVFIAMRKVNGIRFNENLTGFHNYDQSISLDFRKYGYAVLATSKILLEHFSEGQVDKEWVKSTLKFHQVYEKYLPQKIDGEVTKNEEARNILQFMHNCRYTGNRKLAFKYWLSFLMIKPFSNENLKWFNYFSKYFKSKI